MEQTNLINSTFRKNVDSVQNTVATELQAENEIAKILCTKATSVIDNYEALNGELKFNGTVCFTTTYVTPTGEIFALSGQETFSGKLENELINTNTAVMFNSNVIELKVSSTNDEVKPTGVVETEISLILTDCVNYYVASNEDIVTNSNFVNFSTLQNSGKVGFNYSENFESKDNVERMLTTSANAKILDYTLGTDYFTVEGLLFVNFSYVVVKDEMQEYKQFTKCYRFKEELEAENITKEGYLVLNSYVNNCEITTNLTTKDDMTTVEFTVPVNVNYAYFKPTTSEVVVDAYSLKNKLNLNVESFKVDGKNVVKCFDEKIDGQMTIDEDAPRIIKFVAFCGENVSVTNSFKENDNLVIEGVASVNVIYLEEDETERLNSIIVEIPFSVENKFDEFNDGDELSVCAMIKDVDVKCKKGKDINLDLDLSFIVNAFNSLEEMALTNVTVGEALTPKEACLQIYFARKGNTLWDISKGLVAKPEQILDQNPNINLPLENDEKIVLFRGNEER